MTVTLFRGDCIQVTPTLPAQSVHAIITDLPYGTTACKWDTIIPFADLWRVVKHVLMPRGAFVTTASQPFTSALIMSNVEWFKYCWVWEKERGVGFQIAKHRPMMQTEDVAVFGNGSVVYNPQMIPLNRPTIEKFAGSKSNVSPLAQLKKGSRVVTARYPKNILRFARDKSLHPTQKPVALYEYLIRTYTNAGDTVLDLTMGSGTTGVACVNTGRDFIGIELDAGYFAIAEQRIAEAQAQMRLPL